MRASRRSSTERNIVLLATCSRSQTLEQDRRETESREHVLVAEGLAVSLSEQNKAWHAGGQQKGFELIEIMVSIAECKHYQKKIQRRVVNEIVNQKRSVNRSARPDRHPAEVYLYLTGTLTDSRRRSMCGVGVRAGVKRGCASCSVLEDDVESVDDTGNVTEDGQKDVDPEVTVT